MNSRLGRRPTWTKKKGPAGMPPFGGLARGAPDQRLIRQIVRDALAEDIGKSDITTELTVSKQSQSKAYIIVKEPCVVCGLQLAKEAFKDVDSNIRFCPKVKDGKFIRLGEIIAQLQGRTRSILSAERVALNFLALLSGVATKTREYVYRVKPYKARIMDTRKTIPLLRALEKYAVRVGGGHNHRMRLDEIVLIKDNHLAYAHSAKRIAHSTMVRSEAEPPRRGRIAHIEKTIRRIQKSKPKDMKVEVEVKNLNEVREALNASPDIIMLDNMSIEDMKKAVSLKRHAPCAMRHAILEASGGITLKNIRKVAATGVDWISIGDLTHSVRSIDMSLELT